MMRDRKRDSSGGDTAIPVLWGYRAGHVLHLVGQEKDIPFHARTRCRLFTFSSRGQLAFVAGHADIVRTLSGNRIEGACFNRFDAEGEFARLAAAAPGLGATRNA